MMDEYVMYVMYEYGSSSFYVLIEIFFIIVVQSVTKHVYMFTVAVHVRGESNVTTHDEHVCRL